MSSGFMWLRCGNTDRGPVWDGDSLKLREQDGDTDFPYSVDVAFAKLLCLLVPVILPGSLLWLALLVVPVYVSLFKPVKKFLIH